MKKNIFFSMALALALLLTLGASNILAQSYTVTVKLLDSNNNGLPDGEVKYYNGGWQLLGTTDGTGTVSGLVPKHPNTNNRDFLMQYKAGRDYSQKAVDITTNPTLTYQTVPLTIKLETCDGTPLDGTAMQYIGGWQDLGPTPITVERLPNPSTNYAIGMNFDNRKDLTTFNAVNPATTPEVIFKTTKITFSNNTVFWYNGGWKTFTSPKEVLAGIGWAHFKIGDVHKLQLPVHPDAARPLQRLHRRLGQIEQLVLRNETLDVPGRLRPEVPRDPRRDPGQLLGRIVLPGHDQRRHFEPLARFADRLARIEHRFDPGDRGNLLVEVVVEPLDRDRDPIEHLEEVR